MMKLWLLTRGMLNLTNPHWPLSSHTLHIRHNNRFLISYPHLPRRKLRLDYPISTCQRSLHILYLSIHARRTRNILRLLHLLRNMKYRDCAIVYGHGYSLHRICLTMRPNVFLRGNRNHQPPVSNPIYWDRPSRVNLRGFLSRQSYPDTILCLPLHPSVYRLSPSSSPPPIPSRNRIQ